MISIIIPIYNREKYIEECVQSICAQSYSDWEILLIDDGSTDRTLELCQKLADEEARIKVLQIKHAGVSAARNVGIEAAKGEYLFFLDSDDVIHPLLLEALVRGFEQSDAGIGGTAVVNVPEKYWDKVSEHVAQDVDPGVTTYQNHEETLEAVFHTWSPINVIGGVMIRRDLIGETRFRTDLFIGEDFYFIYENLIKGASTVFLKQKWYYCRHHEHNSSWNFDFSGYMNRFYRRELVWKSEEAFGRTEYAACQKRQAFGFCVACMRKHKPYSSDSRKMRKVLRAYKKELFPALKLKQKIGYYLYVYIPFSSLFV